MTLPAELSVMLGRLERELRAGAVSAESEAWLQQCGLTAEQMKNQMEAEYIPRDTSSLPLRPPGRAGAHQPGRGNGVAGGV